MDGIKRIMVLVMSVTCTCSAYGMDGQHLKVYVVPGLGGHKSEENEKNRAYTDMLFDADECNSNIDKTFIITPAEYGLALEKNAKYLETAINADAAKEAQEGKKYHKRIILAFSQGAAAVANLIREQKLTNIPPVNGIIVEGLFLSVNDALHDSVHGQRHESYSLLRDLPCLRYWLPLFAQMIKFPHYRPAGPQPMHALQHVPKELPFIIIHGQSDQRVSYEDNAPIVYCMLRNEDKKDVYLISKEGSQRAIEQERDHVTVLDKKDVPIVHAILRKHGILPAKDGAGQIDLKQYQPTVTQSVLNDYIARYHLKHWQHRIHERIEQGIDAATIMATLAITYWAYKRITEKNHAISTDDVTHLPNAGFYLSNVLAFCDQYLAGK